MKMYYTHNGTEQEGPFTLEELKNRNLTTETPIWYEGLTAWTTADRVYELRDIFPVSGPMPPGIVQTIPPPFQENTKQRSMRKIIFYAVLILSVLIAAFIALDLLDRG